jgi:hypothetical protein
VLTVVYWFADVHKGIYEIFAFNTTTNETRTVVGLGDVPGESYSFSSFLHTLFQSTPVALMASRHVPLLDISVFWIPLSLSLFPFLLPRSRYHSALLPFLSVFLSCFLS